MTITDNRTTDSSYGLSDALLQARAFLLPGSPASGGCALPAVLISALDVPEPTGPADIVTELPTLDGWIVDLSLRDERITLVTSSDVLCSAPLFLLPDGWTAAVAAQGRLAVVVHLGPDGPNTDHVRVPAWAVREPTSLRAWIPVCLV